MNKRAGKRAKTAISGIVCLVLGFISLNASAQTTDEEMYDKGYEYYMAENYAKAFEWWSKAADNNVYDAIKIVSYCEKGDSLKEAIEKLSN